MHYLISALVVAVVLWASPSTPYDARPAPLGSLQGRVLSLYGEPLQGARVEMVMAGRSFAVETDPQGHFKVERVPADKYEVTVQLRGFARWIDTIYVAPGVTQVLNVGLPLLRIDDRVAAVVEGGVRDEQGALVPGVTVTAFAVVNPRIVHSTLTQAQGRFSLPIPGGGLYVLSAHKPGFEADARALVIPQRPQSPIAFTLRPLKID